MFALFAVLTEYGRAHLGELHHFEKLVMDDGNRTVVAAFSKHRGGKTQPPTDCGSGVLSCR